MIDMYVTSLLTAASIPSYLYSAHVYFGLFFVYYHTILTFPTLQPLLHHYLSPHFLTTTITIHYPSLSYHSLPTLTPLPSPFYSTTPKTYPTLPYHIIFRPRKRFVSYSCIAAVYNLNPVCNLSTSYSHQCQGHWPQVSNVWCGGFSVVDRVDRVDL